MLFTDPLLARVPDTQFAHWRNVCWGPIFRDLRPLGLDLMMFLAQQGSPPLPTSQCVLLKNASRVMALLPSKPCRGSHFTLSKSPQKGMTMTMADEAHRSAAPALLISLLPSLISFLLAPSAWGPLAVLQTHKPHYCLRAVALATTQIPTWPTFKKNLPLSLNLIHMSPSWGRGFLTYSIWNCFLPLWAFLPPLSGFVFLQSTVCQIIYLLVLFAVYLPHWI